MYSAVYVWTVKNELNHLPTYFHDPKTGNKPSSSPQKKQKNKNLYLTSGLRNFSKDILHIQNLLTRAQKSYRMTQSYQTTPPSWKNLRVKSYIFQSSTTGAPKAPAKELHRRPFSCYFAKTGLRRECLTSTALYSLCQQHMPSKNSIKKKFFLNPTVGSCCFF